MKFGVNRHDAHKHSKMQQTMMHTSIAKCNKSQCTQAFQNASNPNAIDGSKARKENIVFHTKTNDEKLPKSFTFAN